MASRFREQTAFLVERVLQRATVRELVVEGGSTAATIIGRQKFTRFTPVKELSPGVIRMRVEGHDLYLTIKPGSYDWSAELWRF